MVIRHRQLAALFKVLIKGFHRRGMQGNQSALTELGMTNPQDAIGQDIMDPEVERLGNAEPGCGNQPQQRPVDLPSKRICLAKPTSRFNKLHNFLRRVDVG